ALSFATFSLAQDTTKTRNRVNDKTQTKEQVKDQKRVMEKTNQPGAEQNQIQHGYRFVDENGDGYNDNAPDADGDGIPNGLDPDYNGPKNRRGKGTKGYVDADGDGINDNIQAGQRGKGRKGGYGPGDGTGNKGVGPKDGTGNGPKTGGCDGTGPKGKGSSNRGSNK
ncbi:MAG: hypothetical protein JSW07_19555, partial [bacterium]